MRNELRCIGFELENRDSFKKLALKTLHNYDTEFVYNHDETTKTQRIKYFGKDFGVISMSTSDSSGNININSIQPYFETSFIQRLTSIKIKEVDTDIHIAYGIEEYSNIMISFFVQNNFIDLYENKSMVTGNKDVKLYALSSNSKVILPNTPTSINNIPTVDITTNGDIENLLESTVEEKMALIENIFEKLNEVKSRDTIYLDLNISNIFEKLKEYIHYIGNNTYEFLGTINSVETEINKETNVKIFKICIDISGIYLDVLVNEFDLYGLPILGMRLLGTFKFCGEILKDS